MDLIFRYAPGRSLLYRYDPRLKLVALVIISLSIARSPLPGAVGAAALLTLLLFTAGPPFEIALRLTGALLRFLTLIALLYGTVAGFTGLALLDLLDLLLRLAAYMLLGFLYTATTSPRQIRGTFYALGRRIPGFPASGFALMVSVVLSTIPLFFSALVKNREAIAARGGLSWYRPVRRLRSLTIPLLTRLFRRSDLLSDALLVRGYHRDRSFSLGPIERRQLWTSLGVYAGIGFLIYLFIYV